MIRESLEYVGAHYLAATQQTFSKHTIADYLRQQAAHAVSDAIGNSYYICKGSPGQGNWADVPWIGIFDPTVTDTATRGYYVVYLFSADMQHVYLCLGQGTTAVREEFKRDTHDALIRFGGLMRDRLPEAKGRFSANAIELHGNTTLARDYEPAVALSVGYDIGALPSEEQLRADLAEMIRLYSMLVARGGRDTFEDAASEEEVETEGKTIVERRRYRQHRKIERNSKAARLAKQIHGCICQCCGFDFKKVFGDFGTDYIEAHHLTPLSELPEDVPVTQDPQKDFAVLCANCHRMAHRKGSPSGVAALSALPGVKWLREVLKKQ